LEISSLLSKSDEANPLLRNSEPTQTVIEDAASSISRNLFQEPLAPQPFGSAFEAQMCTQPAEPVFTISPTTAPAILP